MKRTIGIEIGHWQNDCGAVNNGVYESHLNLVVGREINRQLKRHGFETILNGKEEDLESLNRGAGTTIHGDSGFYGQLKSKSESGEIDLAAGIAVHFNAGGGEGFEVYVQTTCCPKVSFATASDCQTCPPRGHSNHRVTKSAALSRAIINRMSIIGQIMRSQGPKDIAVEVLRGTRGLKTSTGQPWEHLVNKVSAPFAYCEFGFIDNEADRAKFDTEEKQRAFGRAAARGILNYLGVSWISETSSPPFGVINIMFFRNDEHHHLLPYHEIMINTGTALTSLPEPTPREGFVFAGWFTEKVGGIRVTTDTVFNETSYIYEQWYSYEQWLSIENEYGIDWSLKNTPADNEWSSIAYGNGRFVAVAANSDNGISRVMTSPDGENWTLQDAPENTWASICFGNGVFVAISNRIANNSVMTSSNGINWTTHSTPTDSSWNSICFGNGTFVAVTSSGRTNDDKGVMTSHNGQNWSLHTVPQGTWSTICYGNGLFVAVDESKIMTSPNATDWTLRAFNGSSIINHWNGIVYGNGRYVALSDIGNFWTSADSVSWTFGRAHGGNTWRSLCYGNGFFVAVSNGHGTISSRDGINWTPHFTPAVNHHPQVPRSQNWRSVCFGKNLFVSVGGNGSGLMNTNSGRRVMTATIPILSSPGGEDLTDPTPPTCNLPKGGTITSPSANHTTSVLNGNTQEANGRPALDINVLELIAGTHIKASDIYGIEAVTLGENRNRQAFINVNEVASPMFHSASTPNDARIWSIMSHGGTLDNGGRTEEQTLRYMNQYGGSPKAANNAVELTPFVADNSAASFNIRIRSNQNEPVDASCVTAVTLLGKNGEHLGTSAYSTQDAGGTWSPFTPICGDGGTVSPPSAPHTSGIVNGNALASNGRPSLDVDVSDLIRGTCVKANEVYGIEVVTWEPNSENRQAFIEVNGVVSPMFHASSSANPARIWSIMSHGNTPDNGGRTPEQTLRYMNRYGSGDASDIVDLSPFVTSPTDSFNVRIRPNDNHPTRVDLISLLGEDGQVLGTATYSRNQGVWLPFRCVDN
jgi:N-acetylmuramoyl-L-alanine amidase